MKKAPILLLLVLAIAGIAAYYYFLSGIMPKRNPAQNTDTSQNTNLEGLDWMIEFEEHIAALEGVANDDPLFEGVVTKLELDADDSFEKLADYEYLQYLYITIPTPEKLETLPEISARSRWLRPNPFRLKHYSGCMKSARIKTFAF